ncbi:MAG: glycosyltransferase family 39 protein [Microgenomates group bacterium]|jgi:4-amino-4-deoxy-L-arabinose transferase-like glycosyltransferase
MRIKTPSIYVFIISVIFLLGLLLRVVSLQNFPPGFNADEAALGYNAYSIIQTGKDEWGQTLPLVFKSFSDYKPGLYVYLDIPFVYLFGLNELAVRLPSIILGSFSIILIYLLSKLLFKKEVVALSTAFLLAISPWHLHFSRGAWEANVATFFMLLGVFSFLKSFTNRRFLWVSALAFIASMYVYQSTRLVTPALLLLIGLFHWKRLLIKKNILIITASFILLLPLILILPTTAGLARLKGVSIFSDPGPINRANEERGQHQDPDSISAKFFHNYFFTYSKSYFKHYTDHMSPDFLFISGGSLKRNEEPNMGQMYRFEIITLLLGLYFLFRNKFKDSEIIILWFIVAPIASSLTFQTPDAHRSHNMVIPLILVSGSGLGFLIEKIWQIKKIFRSIFLILLFFIISFFVVDYMDNYYVHLPKEYALEWEYGFSQMVPYVLENQNKYQKIVITDRYDQPYILLLFYSKYDPTKYQRMIKKEGDNKFGFTTVTNFDKYEFRPVSQEEVLNDRNTLFVGTGEEIKQGNVLKTINFPNGSPAFKITGI